MILDWERVRKIGRVMERRGLTIPEIMDRGGISQRTAYRWVQVLEDRGCTVAKVRSPGGVFVHRILKAPGDLLG